MAVYSDSGRQPDARLNSGASTAITAGWNNIFIDPTSIESGTYYWLAVVADSNIVCCDIAAGNRRYKSASYSGWNWPATAGGGWTTLTNYTAIIAGWSPP